ncbi:GGDEF domain-containing protein [Endothiovibrio diazotrophicus]
MGDVHEGRIRVSESELRGFSRSIAELEWLLLVLVLFYTQVPGTAVEEPGLVVVAMVLYAAFILLFRYLAPRLLAGHWRTALESWAMLLFLSVALWATGKAESPLLNGYLLVIIASALTLGRRTTLLQVALVSVLYLFMAYAAHGEALFTLALFSQLMARFVPVVLVAHLTTLFSADIHSGMETLRERADHDELTGLPNLHAFQQRLAAERRAPCAVLLIDADNLAQVNDEWGLEAGNRMMKVLAGTIGDGLREGDLLARHGGSTFVALLPGVGSDQALAAARAIRARVEDSTLDLEAEEALTTVTIGVAAHPQHAATPEALIASADDALNLAKLTGRNSVMLAAAAV